LDDQLRWRNSRRIHHGCHRCELRHRGGYVERTVLGVRAATTGYVDMGDIRSLAAAGVIKQPIEIGQRKATAQKNGGEYQRMEATTQAATHGTSLGRRPWFAKAGCGLQYRL
jgi:hypothetical protein